jgi:tripartite-type tricarboxylate transporter receptor subunit TctC
MATVSIPGSYRGLASPADIACHIGLRPQSRLSCGRTSAYDAAQDLARREDAGREDDMARSAKILLSICVAAMPLIVGANAAQAQDYPNREIHAISMYPPGSGADVFIRHFSEKLSKGIGKTVVVENKVGAFGMIGVESVARAKPDGYTVTMISSALFAGSQSLYKQVPFDPLKDFEYVTTLTNSAFVLVVDAKSPVNTVAELTKLMKEKGDKGSYAAVSSASVIGAELYKSIAKLETVQVNFKEMGQALNSLASGEVGFMFTDSATGAAQTRAGRVKQIALSSAKRMDSQPGIPSATEAGLTGMDLTSWWVAAVPAKTPKPILDKLEAVFNEAVKSEDTKKFVNNLGADPYPGSQALVKERLPLEIQKWAEYVKTAKIERQ